jgi:hypothetical protein
LIHKLETKTFTFISLAPDDIQDHYSVHTFVDDFDEIEQTSFCSTSGANFPYIDAAKQCLTQYDEDLKQDKK